jgi:membrane fusion protein (multidrug efflux system)
MHDTKGRPYVYVVGGDNRLREQMITTGQMTGENWLVETGLKPGDSVVVEGLQNVQPGTLVKTSQRRIVNAQHSNLTTADPSAH